MLYCIRDRIYSHSYFGTVSPDAFDFKLQRIARFAFGLVYLTNYSVTVISKNRNRGIGRNRDGCDY
jgi:hypothetical protein